MFTDLTAFSTRLGNTLDLTDGEKALFARLATGPAISFEPGRDLIGCDEPAERAYVLLDGWAIWQDIRADGSRQVLDFFLPGDAVALGAMLSGDRPLGARRPRTPHHVTAVNSVVAVPIERRTFAALVHRHPELSTQLLAQAFADRADRFHRRMTNFGRASARARTADFLLEIWERLREAGRAKGSTFSMPVSQTVLADFLCIAPSYLSRILTALEQDGVVTVQSSGERMVVIHYPDWLRHVATDEHEAELSTRSVS